MLFNPDRIDMLFPSAVLLLLLAVTITPAKAIENSATLNAPINIAADSAEQNEKKGITIYRGNVSIEQGSLTINADTVTIQTKNVSATAASGDSANQTEGDEVIENTARSVTTIIASGLPARFTQTPPGQSNAINASGNTIRYAIDTGVIQLEENASIDKLGSKVSGEKIEYFINEELVRAVADPSDKKTRVHTVIIPGSGGGFSLDSAVKDSAEKDSGGTANE